MGPTMAVPAGMIRKGSVAPPASSLPALEYQFGQSANEIYEALLDLNTPIEKLFESWQGIIGLRGKILKVYGVDQGAMPGLGAPGVKAPFPPAGPVPAAAEVDWSTFDWKSKLMQAVSSSAKRSLTKGELVYTTEDAEGGGFVSHLSTQGLLQGEYSSAEAQPSKRGAEHAAAKAAMEAEFALVYAGILQNPSGGKQNQLGTKRKRDGGDQVVPEPDVKSRLNHTVQLLLKRPLQKGDIIYDMTSPEGGSGFVAALRLPNHDPDTTYEGQLSSSKQDAERSAAEAGLAALAEVLTPLEEEHRAKKAAKNRESLEALKLRTAQKAGAVKEEASDAKPIPSGRLVPAGRFIPG